jgi:hypothetical protein
VDRDLAPARPVTTASEVGPAAAAAIVAACYEQLLGHPPDDTALRTYAESLRADAVGRFAPMLAHLNVSASAERVRGHKLLGEIGRRFLARRGASARPAVSLGVHCYTALLLKSAGIQREPNPFDAIFASPRMIAHCLDDDFATLLAQTQYQPVPVERRVHGAQVNLCDHAWYRDNFGIEYLFNHCDPTTPGDYAALRESVEAFRATAQSTPATYVSTAPDALYWQNGFAQVSRALRAYAPFTRLVYAVVREPGAALVPRLEVVSEDEGHVLVDFRPSSSWGPAGFENPLDDVSLLSFVLERL